MVSRTNQLVDISTHIPDSSNSRAKHHLESAAVAAGMDVHVP
jgi:hypothetical protein